MLLHAAFPGQHPSCKPRCAVQRERCGKRQARPGVCSPAPRAVRCPPSLPTPSLLSLQGLQGRACQPRHPAPAHQGRQGGADERERAGGGQPASSACITAACTFGATSRLASSGNLSTALAASPPCPPGRWCSWTLRPPTPPLTTPLLTSCASTCSAATGEGRGARRRAGPPLSCRVHDSCQLRLSCRQRPATACGTPQGVHPLSAVGICCPCMEAIIPAHNRLQQNCCEACRLLSQVDGRNAAVFPQSELCTSALRRQVRSRPPGEPAELPAPREPGVCCAHAEQHPHVCQRGRQLQAAGGGCQGYRAERMLGAGEARAVCPRLPGRTMPTCPGSGLRGGRHCAASFAVTERGGWRGLCPPPLPDRCWHQTWRRRCSC